MKRDQLGQYRTLSKYGENVKAYIPAPLPPVPPIDWGVKLRIKFDQAHAALGSLNIVSKLLPDARRFYFMFVRKEAVLSSRIEGMQASLEDLLLYEMGEKPNVPLDDVIQVNNYVEALYHGVSMLDNGLPFSLRLIKETHKVLMEKGPGSACLPGEFRRLQNWVGGRKPSEAIFIPPPPESLMDCLGKLELFINDIPEQTPALLKVALMHLQFETIHPFIDGNGRTGRLLNILLLYEQKLLDNLMVYLSLYLKTHRQTYYRLLDSVRKTGDWEEWLSFFADSVIVAAGNMVDTLQTLHMLAETYTSKIRGLGRASISAHRIHKILMEFPVVTPSLLVKRTGLTPATVNKALMYLKQIGVVQELTTRKRNRLFHCSGYLEIFNVDTGIPE
jgi:Fic family protein